MKKFLLLPLLIIFLAPSDLQSQSSQKTQAITWQDFSASSTVLGVIHKTSKPLQYNDELDLVSFVQRISPYYPVTPTPTLDALTGVVVGFVTTNWGISWDSTCLWSNNNYWARFPQGGVYNPPGNSNVANAYLVGTGPCLNTGATWEGNWFASKQIGTGNYNTTASTVSNAQQMLSSNSPLPVFGRCNFARNSFNTTDDGVVHSLGSLISAQDPSDYNGAMVLKGTYNAGVFNWTGDSIVGLAAYNSLFQKVMVEPVMAWNESGTVGYVVFPGSRYGSVGSNVGIQPIVYRTTNSGNSWQIMPAMDFDSPDALPLKKLIPSVNSANPNPNLTIPNMQVFEGWDAVVDKNDALHVACLINGAGYSSRDSLFNPRSYGFEGYNWKHSPGRRPYLVDFILHQGMSWSYGIVDSLSTELPGIYASQPGSLYNPWGTNSGTTNASRINCSRTPDGRFITITFTESDTNLTTFGVKWNMLPDLKARLIDANTYALSPTKINLSVGTNTNVNGRATMHFAAPRSSTAAIGPNTFDLKLPVTISNNPSFNVVFPCTHWFSAADLNFSNLTFPFTQTITNVAVGMTEMKLTENNQFEVYPNPFTSSFKLHWLNKNTGSYTIDLYDVSGRRMYSETTTAAEFEVNVADLKKGIYVMRVTSEFGLVHKKIVKD